MSIKDFFYSKQTTATNAATASAKVESLDYITTKLVSNRAFTPHLDFASASNFAKFGSAHEYYTRAIERVYDNYPYDGSEKEKLLFQISSSYLDEYIFDKKYPKTTGYITLSYDTWGTAASITDGYGLPNSSDDYEYIFVKGGLHTRTGLKDSKLKTIFKSSPVIYDSAKDRTTTFVLNMADGFSVEFWLKKDAFDLTKTKKEVILDLWNGEDSSSVNYGRFILELSGTADAEAGQDVIRATLYSGSTGFFSQPIGTSTITTGSLSSWAHYAFTAVSGGAGIISRLYKNGDLNETKTFGSVGMGDIPGLFNGYIGALQTSPPGSSAAKYAGKLSASMDDFRFWKKRRTSEQIYNNWYQHVGGGTNSDDANINLGLYFKFNEGTVGSTGVDSVVLDYSGRIANGTWTGYTSGARNSGSAFISSSLVAREPEDPIIYKAHADVEALLTEMQTSGSDWDEKNPSLLYNSIPQWIRDEDEAVNSNVKYLFQIIASYFDTLYSQITVLPHLKNIQYIGAKYKPKPFADRLIEDKGLLVPNLFVNSDILEKYGRRDSNKILFDEDISDIKNFIYTNIYNNLNFILKSKGTEKSIRNMLRCFGIDDELVKLNLYTDGGTHYFSDKRKHTSIRKNFINFNSVNTFTSSVYQTSSTDITHTFVTGSGADKYEKYSAMTSEITIKVPHKLKDVDGGFFFTPFISASVFGMHEPLYSTDYNNYAWRSNEVANFQVYLVRDKQESSNAKFVLTNQDGSIYLTSSFYSDIYEDEIWTLAVSIKPDNYPFAGGHLEKSDPTYTLEFYGVTHAFEDVAHEFSITKALSYASGSSFLSNSKRFYVGAHWQDFTGSILQKTDLKVGTFRHYLDLLGNQTIKNHNLDMTNYSTGKGSTPTTAFNNQLSGIPVASCDSVVINWDFNMVTGSGASGYFTVEDFSSGSTDTVYGWVDNVISKKHNGTGYGFPVSNSGFVLKESTFVSKKELPEISYTADTVTVADEEEKFFIEDEDVSDNFFILEKSMNQVVSEEMLNMFSSVSEFNSLIGKATDRYRMNYKKLDFVRQMFFQRNSGSLDYEKFTDYYKWIDSSVSFMVNQLFPISVRHSEGVLDVIESHILERNKYQNKFPLLKVYPSTETSAKGISELKYNWKRGHAPLTNSDDDNCLWQKERSIRSDITERETIRSIIINDNNASSSVLAEADKTKYQRSLYGSRRLAKPYSMNSAIQRKIHGGINYPIDKDREFIHNAVHRHGPKTTMGVPKNVLLVGEGLGQGTKDQTICNDSDDPNLLKKIHVRATVGRFSKDGLYPSASSDAESYIYRTDESRLPLNIISSSMSTGYNNKVSASFKGDAIFTNIHSDTTDFTNEVPMQGPFTEAWVGGHQSRHIDINKYDASLVDDFTGTAPKNSVDNQYTRPEAWRLLLGDKYSPDGAFGFAGFDYGGPYPDPTRKGATYYRGERAKRPVNLENIRTTTGSKKHGNFMENFELISAVGKQENNLYFRNNPEQINYLPASVTASLPETTHPLTLMAYAPLAKGNVFGAHSNSRQPDIAATVGATASAEFNAYGTSGSSEYALINTWVEGGGRNHGLLIEDMGISIGVSGTDDYSGDFDALVRPTGSSVAYWNELNRLLTLAPAITSTYSIVNAVDNYSQGLKCHSINGQNVALSSSTFVGASGSAAFTYSSWINISTSSTGHFKNLFYVAESKGGGQRSVEIKIDTNGHLSLTRYGVTGGGFSSNSTIQINDFQESYSGSWIHLACRTGTDYTQRGNSAFYVNGLSQSVDSESVGGGTAWTISGAVFVMSNGHQADSNYYPFQGKFDEISYWKNSLTADQIVQLYNCGTRFDLTGAHAESFLPTVTDLASWWTFDDSTITGSLYTDFTITDHAARFGANTLTVKDKYQEAGSGILLTPVSGVINAKPMALFSLKTSANTSAYNGETAQNGVALTEGFVTSSATTMGESNFVYLNCSSSFSGTLLFAGGVDDVLESRNLHSINDSLLDNSKNRTIITSRFSAPGGIEVQSKGYLDAYSHEYSVHNALPYRNLTIRGSGSGESGTIRQDTINSERIGLRTMLSRHSGKHGSDRGNAIGNDAYTTVASFHKIQRNRSRKPVSTSTLEAPVFNEDHNNGFFQSPIPQSDYQYSWVTASIGTNYAIGSGKQRHYGYNPRDGELVERSKDQSTKFALASSHINIGSHSTWNALVGAGSSNRVFACAFWIKRTPDPVTHAQTIISFSYRDLQLTLVDGQLQLEVDWSGNNGIWLLRRTLNVNRWYHVVIVYDGSSTSNNMIAYVDGEAMAEITETSTPAGSLSAISGFDCFIGNNRTETEAFIGNLDQFAIYNDGLTESNVATLYGSGNRMVEYAYKTDLVLYYRMGAGNYERITSYADDTITQFYDISGNGRNSSAAFNISFSTEYSYTVYDGINFPTASEIFGV